MIHFGSEIYNLWNRTFVFNYKSNGVDIEKTIRVDDDLIMDGEILDVCLEDCRDLSECILILSKHIVKDNDGDVFVKFIDEDGDTLTCVNSMTRLTKDLNFPPDEGEDWVLTLNTRNGDDQVTQYNFVDVSEEDIYSIREMMDDEDDCGLNDFIWDNSDSLRTIETLTLYDPSSIGYELCDENGDEIDSGVLQICPENIHDYRPDWSPDQIIDETNPPKYILIKSDLMEDTYSTFNVPKNFCPGDIHFVGSFPSYQVLSWEGFGDEMVTIQGVKYHGKIYGCDDYGDDGSMGETHFCLMEWDEDRKRYRVVSEF